MHRSSRSKKLKLAIKLHLALHLALHINPLPFYLIHLNQQTPNTKTHRCFTNRSASILLHPLSSDNHSEISLRPWPIQHQSYYLSISSIYSVSFHLQLKRPNSARTTTSTHRLTHTQILKQITRISPHTNSTPSSSFKSKFLVSFFAVSSPLPVPLSPYIGVYTRST